jgi:hypothetical protein
MIMARRIFLKAIGYGAYEYGSQVYWNRGFWFARVKTHGGTGG